MNQGNYAVQESKLDVERPEFGRLLESLQKEANYVSDLSSTLKGISIGIKQMEIAPEKEQEPI